MPKPVLFVLAHPDLSASRANKALARAADKVDNVIVHDLYAKYPDLFIDGIAERELIDATSAIVIQIPIYWYAGPGLLKEWFDRAFISGWAYGTKGKALKGKKFLCSITTGSDQAAYSPKGIHANPITDYLLPYQQTATFCGMKWQHPLVFHHAREADDAALATHIEALESQLTTLAKKG